MIEKGAKPDTMFSVRKKPWHGIGPIVDHLLRAADALKAAGLDWTVRLGEIFTADMVKINDAYAVTREDNGRVLGIVGKKYVPIQNESAFAFVDAIIGDGSAKFETAGSLFGGKTVFILACLPDDVLVAGDTVKTYFLLTTTHDGSGAVRVLLTPIRVVCQNTLNLAINGAKRIHSVPHTLNYERSLHEARTTLGITRKYYESFATFAENLALQAFTQSQFESLMRTLIPLPEEPGRGRTVAEQNQEQLLKCLRAPDLDNVRFTKYGAYNAVADYADHSRRLIGDAEQRASNAYRRTFDNTTLKDRALELLMSN